MKTVDDQFLWMKTDEKDNYQTLYELLHAEWFIDFEGTEMLLVGPNQDPHEYVFKK